MDILERIDNFLIEDEKKVVKKKKPKKKDDDKATVIKKGNVQIEIEVEE